MKLIISSDFLMTSEPEQNSNLRWIKDLIGESIDCNKIYFSKKFNEELAFERSVFFEKSSIHLTSEKHFDFNVDEISNNSLEYLSSYIGSEDIVVGYEMSDKTRNILNKLNIKYIDIWLGPIRFLDDITFAVGTNSKEIRERISKFQYDENLIRDYAKLIKVQFYRGFNRQCNYYDPNSALFVGQMDIDKSVLSNGKFLNLLDFKNRFKEISTLFTKIYYSKHPFLKEVNVDVDAFINKIKNVEIVDNNVSTYSVLCNENINLVFAISSSVCAEAKYFNKKVEYLFHPPFDIENDYCLIGQQLVSRNFWNFIVNNKNFVSIDPTYLGKDKLRDAMGFYWGYRAIDKVEYLRRNLNWRSK